MSSDGNSTVPLWINNEAVHTEVTFPVTQATTGNVVHSASSASPSEATQAATTSWTAFQSWRNTTHTERRDLLLRVAAYYEANTEDLVARQMEETCCTEGWARQNVTLSVSYIKEIAAQVSSISGTIPPTEKPNTLGFVFREPIGPILCIAPWNAALILATRGIASAMAVGCSVIFKASELCPKTHSSITQAFISSGAPPGVLNQIQCRRSDAASITETLIAHDAIRKIEFIGSAAIGKQIMSTASRYLKPVLMELGGKCPAIILPDADLDAAAKQCALGAVLNHGQICFSTERIIVHTSILPQFQENLVREMANMQTPAGNAVSAPIAAHAEDVIRDAQHRGETVMLGGAAAEPSLSLRPTLILNPSKSRIVDEETFGPSASLYTVSSDAEAIQVANQSNYGLNATVWTRDMARFMNIARQLDYGQVHANSISVYTSPTGSQGGVKGSGFGRQNGRWGLEEFVVEKFVSWCG